MNSRRGLALALVGLAFPAVALARPPAGPASVPFEIDHNRVVVQVEMRRADGSPRRARAWLDLWGSEVQLTGSLARDLGLALTPGTARSIQLTATPPVAIGGKPADVRRVGARVVTGSRWLVPGLAVDVKLPLTAWHAYQVVLDYPSRTLTIGPPRGVPRRGTRVPAIINPKNGMIQIEASIDGAPCSLAIDGASYSAVSDTFIRDLAAGHSSWTRRTGAVGAANAWGMSGEETWPMLRVPLALGRTAVTHAGIVGPPGFIDYYSSQALKPVKGLLGGNVLAAFRVEFHFDEPAIYLDGGPVPPDLGRDLDLVGLTLQPQPDGTFRVVAVAVGQDGQPSVEGIEPGDQLVLVDGHDITGADMGAAIDRLRGKPGETHVLALERKGRRFLVTARVARLL